MHDDYLLQLPYPKVLGQVTPKEIEKLYDLYAGRFSEFTSTTTYIYQAVISNCISNLSEILTKISIAEMHHINLLANALISFGADPVFAGAHNYFTCNYTNYSKDVREFLSQDIEWETSAKEEYLEFASKTKNQSLCELLTRIAMDEEMHAEILKQIYKEIFCESYKD